MRKKLNLDLFNNALDDYKFVQEKLYNHIVDEEEIRQLHGATYQELESKTERLVKHKLKRDIKNICKENNILNKEKRIFISNEIKILYDMRIFININEMIQMFRCTKRSDVRALREKHQRSW